VQVNQSFVLQEGYIEVEKVPDDVKKSARNSPSREQFWESIHQCKKKE
jgi:hypothetical protein